MNKIKLTDDQVNALYMAGHDGECLGDAYESTLNTAIELGIVRPAAADAASGERVVWYNGPASGYAIVIDDWMRRTFTEVGPRQITIEVRGEELVVRKVRGG